MTIKIIWNELTRNEKGEIERGNKIIKNVKSYKYLSGFLNITFNDNHNNQYGGIWKVEEVK